MNLPQRHTQKESTNGRTTRITDLSDMRQKAAKFNIPYRCYRTIHPYTEVKTGYNHQFISWREQLDPIYVALHKITSWNHYRAISWTTGVDSRKKYRFFSSSPCSDRLWSSPILLTNWNWRTTSFAVMQPWYEVYHSPPLTAEVKNA
jgi:hypothetical protein